MNASAVSFIFVSTIAGDLLWSELLGFALELNLDVGLGVLVDDFEGPVLRRQCSFRNCQPSFPSLIYA